jgi:DNA-binding response OmpR family regulator
MSDPKILIIDDERNICFILGTYLENHNFSVDLVANGEEALAKIKNYKYALVFLDMKMPGMDGIAVLRAIKEIHPHLNVIMMTAYGTVQTAVDAMKLGAVDFLSKPFDPENVRDLVEAITARQSLKIEYVNDYLSLVEYAKGLIVKQEFIEAQQWLRKAIAADASQPIAFNLLGTLMEMENNMLQAQKMYRVALALDPTCEPANENLHRTVSWDYSKENLLYGKEVPAELIKKARRAKSPKSTSKESSL